MIHFSLPTWWRVSVTTDMPDIVLKMSDVNVKKFNCCSHMFEL